MAIDDDVVDEPEAVEKGLFQLEQVLSALGHLLSGQLRGLSHAHDPQHVVGSPPLAVLLHSPVEQGPDLRLRTDVEGPHP